MISPVPDIDALWFLTESPDFCQRFPLAAQAARGAVVAVAQVGGLLEEAYENGSGETDKKQDRILLSMIKDELTEQLLAIGGERAED